MNFESIILINKDNDEILDNEFSINIECCFDNIRAFYRNNNKIYLILSLNEEYTDEEFYKIISDFPYSKFDERRFNIYPKDDEYYPTFVVEMDNDIVDRIQQNINELLNLFMEKVVKIYCNNM